MSVCLRCGESAAEDGSQLCALCYCPVCDGTGFADGVGACLAPCRRCRGSGRHTDPHDVPDEDR